MEEYSPMYARLAEKIMQDLIRCKGMTEEDARKEALRMMLGQALHTVQGLDALSLSTKPRLESGQDIVTLKSEEEPHDE